jgi:hypothetical protein
MSAASSDRGKKLWTAAGRGALAGVVGVAAMTLAEKFEQSVTHRPNSYTPARTLLTILGRRPPNDAEPTVWNHAMHWSTGVTLGALRGVWAAVGLRGPQASVAHTVVRLATDQTLENTTGAGAPPATWPATERLIDAIHKSVYSMTTGAIADRLIRPELESRAGARSH